MRSLFPLFVAFVLTMPAMSLAQQQPHPILSEFIAIRQHVGLLLRWTITGGNQCNGTKVFRSSDGVGFEQIEHIPGVCGSEIDDVTYSYLDTFPLPNAYNHYRLEMGGQGFTETITHFYTYFDNGNHARLTDPVDGSVRLLFSNASEKQVSMEIIDMDGRPMYSALTHASHFNLYTKGWKVGIYIYHIIGSDDGRVTGRMMVGQ
ncbi:MAG: T9SS type A sorting domain-containing protein [Flavobacteriales bacterium]|nr:T9SS type A sorting domain-containing protein [Flavobacteriales bacterium]